MKKLYFKICAFIMLMFCALTGLVACGSTGNNSFSVAACRQGYVKAGYAVVDISKALGDTTHYNNITKGVKDKDGKEIKTKEDLRKEYATGKWYLMTSDNKQLDDKYNAIYNDVYTTEGGNKDIPYIKKKDKDINIYTSNGFIAKKEDTVVVFIAYKSTAELDDFQQQIYKNFYSNNAELSDPDKNGVCKITDATNPDTSKNLIYSFKVK